MILRITTLYLNHLHKVVDKLINVRGRATGL